jgi:hypothetical protein
MQKKKIVLLLSILFLTVKLSAGERDSASCHLLLINPVKTILNEYAITYSYPVTPKQWLRIGAGVPHKNDLAIALSSNSIDKYFGYYKKGYVLSAAYFFNNTVAENQRAGFGFGIEYKHKIFNDTWYVINSDGRTQSDLISVKLNSYNSYVEGFYLFLLDDLAMMLFGNFGVRQNHFLNKYEGQTIFSGSTASHAPYVSKRTVTYPFFNVGLRVGLIWCKEEFE